MSVCRRLVRSLSVAVPLLALAGVAPVPAQTSYNVTLHKNLTQHTGTNDCWGYTSPGGVELAMWGYQTGTSFVDATDPPNATEIFDLPGPTSTWRDIKTYQHYAYIVTEGSAAGTGLQIVDLANPLAPVHVSTYTANNFTTAHNLWIDTATGIAYACGAAPGGGMHILSLANPVAPVEIDFFTPYYIHDLWVGDGVGYAGAINSGTLRILNMTNPANPITVVTHSYAGATTHNAWPNSAKTHVLTTDEVGGGHVKIWDITNLPTVSLAGEYRVTSEPAIVHNVLLRDDMAYISYYAAGTRIVDVTQPTAPVEVGYYDTTDRGSGFDGCWGIYPFRGDNVYYASDRQNGFFVLEFTGGFAGEIRGTVRNAATSAVLDSAYVALQGAPAAVATDGAGFYSSRISGGGYQVVTTRFGFQPDTSNVVIPEHGVLVHDVNLTPLPGGNVDLQVLAARTGLPVAGAVVQVDGTPIVGFTTDATGHVLLPGLPVGTAWNVRIGKFGFAATSHPVNSSAGVTVGDTVQLPPGFSDDFDLDQAWIVGAPGDAATHGIWERAIPVGSYSLGIVGPDADASPAGAGYAYITENHVPDAFAGSSDVDNGSTTLLTPVFDGSGLGDLTVGYTRWFSNRAPVQSSDPFSVDVSTDGGSSWTNLETVTFGTDSWAQVQIPLAGLVVPSSTMQLRFVASDFGADTFVEGGVDDVAFTAGATAAPTVAGSVRTLALTAPTPNPFSSSARLSFDLPRSGPVTLAVHDVAGRRVATLVAAKLLGAGHHTAQWDGRDDTGSTVSPGVYFARLETAEGTISRKVTFVR